MFYNIYAGLGGGFGGASYRYTMDFSSEDEALKCAYLEARDEYESYAGMHGLFGPEDAWENPEDYGVDEMDDETIEMLYEEDLESWVDYYVTPTDEDNEIDPSELEYK